MKYLFMSIASLTVAVYAASDHTKQKSQEKDCKFEWNNSTWLRLYCVKQQFVPKCSQFGVNCTLAKELDLGLFNIITKLYKRNFAEYPNLQVLNLSQNPVTVCETGSFEVLSSLRVLKMDRMYPNNNRPFFKTNLQPHLLQPLVSLKNVVFDETNLDIISMLNNRLCDLSHNMDTISMNHVIPTIDPRPLILNGNLTKCLLQVNVKKLYLEHNKIAVVTSEALRNLRGLQYLSLKGNIILSTPSCYILGALYNSIFIDISCQNFYQCESTYPWNDWLPSEPKEYPISPHVLKINSTVTDMRNNTVYIKAFPNLQTFNMHHIRSIVFRRSANYHTSFGLINNLVNLDISYLGALDFTPILGFSFLKYLNLRGSVSGFLEPYTFSQMTSLEVLMIGSSKLPMHVFRTDNASYLFKYNKMLKFLDLSDLGLNSIPVQLLEPLTCLETIILSHNQLKNVRGLFRQLHTVRNIDLSFNQLSAFPEDVLHHLKKNNLGNSPNITKNIRITGNPILCLCSSLNWLEMVINSKFVKADNFQCTLSNTSAVSAKEAHNILKKECLKRDMTSLIFLFGVYPLPLLIIMIASCLFRVYRWNFIYYYFKAREILIARGREKKYDFHFDAFICYAGDDETLMRNHMLMLESGPNPYRFCLHYRNFMPGREIFDNIISSMDNSKHIILLVTKCFLKSGWCNTESSLALMRQCGQSEKSVLIVLFPDAKRELRRKQTQGKYQSLRIIMDRVTYLEGPVSVDDRQEFCQKMGYALGEPIQHNNDKQLQGIHNGLVI